MPVLLGERSLSLLWYGAIALLTWAYGYTQLGAGDLWWHLAVGRLIVENGAIPATDPWSFSLGNPPWVIDSWLSDVVFYAWQQAFGLYALVWWKWLLLIGIFLLLFRLLHRRAESPVLAALVLWLVLASAAPFLDIRPHLYSLLGLVLLIQLTTERERPSGWLPVLFLIWANLHAGVALGLVLLPILLWPETMAIRAFRRPVALGLASLAASMLNPNGHSVLSQPLLYALEPQSPFRGISEWLSPFVSGGIQSPVFWVPAALFALYLVLSTRPSSEVAPGIRRLLWAGALGLAMALTSRRFIPAASLLMALPLAAAARAWLFHMAARLPDRLQMPAPLALAVLATLWLWPYPQRDYAFHYLTAEHAMPEATVDMLLAAGGGRVFSYYNWGGYLHWRAGDQVQVFVDGRANTAYGADNMRRYLDVLMLRAGWMEIVRKSGAEWLLWPANQGLQIKSLVATDEWRLFVNDGTAVLLTRKPSGSYDLPTNPATVAIWRGGRALALGDGRSARAAFAMAAQERPWDARVCGGLVRADLIVDGPDAARRTMTKCQAIFPMAGREQMLEKMIAERDPVGGGSDAR